MRDRRPHATDVRLRAVADGSGPGPAGSWPWFGLDVDARRFAGRWVRLTYRSGLLEPLVRPVLRCLGDGAPVDRVMNAAPFGRATWLGLVPEGTAELRVSPTTRAGPCAFAIERIEAPSAFDLGRALVRRSRTGWFYWMFAPLVGLRDAGDVQVRRHLSPTDLGRYDAWRRAGTRAFDPSGFDAVADGGDAPVRVRFVARAGAGQGGAVSDLVAALAGQPVPTWSLALLGATPAALPPGTARHHLLLLADDAPFEDLASDLSGNDLVAPFHLGDGMPAYAVAAFARAAADAPDAGGFFADSDRVDRDGRYHSPRFRSDTGASAFDPGPASAFRVDALRAARPALRAVDLLDPRAALAERGLDGPGRLHHVRRVLRTCRDGTDAGGTVVGRRRAASPPGPGDGLRATIVIPTKDRLDLLGRCIASLRTTDGFDRAEVVVVDNGSVREDARAFLKDLASDRRFTVVSDGGPFNFSRLCNAGAARAGSPALVFLNNDTEITDARWLDHLLGWALRPDVGAVGAKLLYPDGSVQHAGVVVGIDGLAGHFERGLARDDPGFFGRLNDPHPVASVTAACLAVEKRKFDAVGGFDEANLPVDLNDVDLCLRLGARGWTCVLQPEAVLIHHESASRGVSLDPDVRYRTEQATFRARWAPLIRDDPHFHPALSLDTLDARLG